MRQYLYAISIVSRADVTINNGLYSGLSNKSAMIRSIRDIVLSYDPVFSQSVAIITCNIMEHEGNGRQFQFRRSYTMGCLESCLEDIIGDIESTNLL